MIDPRSGALTLAGGARLGPETTLAEFRGSPLFASSREGVQNEPWSSWVVPELRAGDRVFRAMLCFSDGRLGMIDLVMQLPGSKRKWFETTPESEAQRKAAHDGWLEGVLGAPSERAEDRASWRLDGAEVVSLLDRRAVSSAIHLRYGWEAEEP